MNTFPPTQNQHNASREGELVPPPPSCDAALGTTSSGSNVARPTTASRTAPSKSSWWTRNLLVLVGILGFSLPAYYLTSQFVVTAVIVQGRSMTPTLKDGERYYLNRWRYMFVEPGHGELVVIRDPGHADFAVKRIVARPNDKVAIRAGALYLNGQLLDEPYLPKGTRTDCPNRKDMELVLGTNQYYVLGDNREVSEDSRFYGVVRRSQIIGQLMR